MNPPSAAPPAAPAISDADLARLLGLASGTPAAAADLAARIMARLPLDPVAEAARAQRPALRPLRQRRWLRIGIGTGASLLIGTAVAASLAQMPALAPYLQPLLARVATLAIAPPPRPTRTAAARPTVSTTAPAKPVRIDAHLPTQSPADMPGLPAPILPSAAPVPAPILPTSATPNAPAPSMRPPARRTMAAAVPTARIAADRALPAAAIRRQAARANIADLSTPPVILPDGPGIPGLASGPDRPVPAPRAAAIIEQRTAHPPADAPLTAEAPTQGAATPLADAAIQGPAPNRPAALPTSAAERAAAMAELRAARAAGTLTAAQAQRLRSLQQLRAARSARTTRDAARRPPN